MKIALVKKVTSTRAIFMASKMMTKIALTTGKKIFLNCTMTINQLKQKISKQCNPNHLSLSNIGCDFPARFNLALSSFFNISQFLLRLCFICCIFHLSAEI